MKTRYFYHTDEEKIYTLSELEKLYNELVASGDINEAEEPFYYYIDACTDKNGALIEIYGNLTVIYTDYGIADGILQAMDGGTEENVKNELCLYILRNGYNSDICDFINSVEWLQDEPGAFKRDFIIYDADTLNMICTMHTTEAEARNYAMMHLININDRLEQIGLQKHKKALVKACYIPNYNNIEFTIICDL